MSFHELECKDVAETLWVFYQYKGDALVLRPEYSDLCCRGCNRIDFLKSLERGVSPEMRGLRSLRDACKTRDSQLLVSNRCHRALQQVAAGLFLTFDLPGDDRYKIIYPTRIIRPPKDAPKYKPVGDFARPGDPFQNRGGFCSHCGRFECVTMWSEYYTVPDDVRLAAIELEPGTKTTLLCWIADDTVSKALGRFTGWSITKNAFKNSAK
jgi:hypothetical protein